MEDAWKWIQEDFKCGTSGIPMIMGHVQCEQDQKEL
jgi:hypothetical protein